MDKEKINRDKILQTIAVLIQRLKRSDITISQIATELGVTHAAIYKHFKNKQEVWEAVSTKWFDETVMAKVTTGALTDTKIERLHLLLWSFINAKKKAYNQNAEMFMLNTQYVESNPYLLRKVLKSIYQKINQIIDYENDNFEHAELILSAFTIFTLPAFKSTWNDPDFESRFENMWLLVEPGIQQLYL